MVAKFIPGFARVANSLAGLVRTPFVAFVLFDTIGAILWSGAALALGWIFRNAVGQTIEFLNRAGRWGLLTLMIVLVLYIAIKALQRHRLIPTLRMARVSVEDLNDMLASEERPLIVDVRSLSSRREGRIPGALWIDSAAFEDSVMGHGLTERTEEEVIVYCACPNEASAAAIAKKLMRTGFKRVRPLGGGIDAWIEKGYPVEIME